MQILERSYNKLQRYFNKIYIFRLYSREWDNELGFNRPKKVTKSRAV